MAWYIVTNVVEDHSGCLPRPLGDTGSMPSPKPLPINHITQLCNLED
jgi:hypothetical protein